MMNKILILISLLLLPHYSLAQTIEAKEGKAFKIAYSRNLEEALYISEKKAMVKLDTLSVNYSKDYFIKEASPFAIYRKTDNADKPYAPALEIKIPNKFLSPLVFVNLFKGELSYTVCDIDANSFPFGSYKVLNITDNTLQCKLAKKSFELLPQGTQVVGIENSEKGNAFHCSIKKNQEENKKIVWESMMMHRPHKRILMIVHLSTDKAGVQTLKVNSLTDFQVKSAQ